MAEQPNHLIPITVTTRSLNSPTALHAVLGRTRIVCYTAEDASLDDLRALLIQDHVVDGQDVVVFVVDDGPVARSFEGETKWKSVCKDEVLVLRKVIPESSRIAECPAVPLSALTTARPIDGRDRIRYPEDIEGPQAGLNVGARRGRIRYDRKFLLQFKTICTLKPDGLPSLYCIASLYPAPSWSPGVQAFRPESQNKPSGSEKERLSAHTSMPGSRTRSQRAKRPSRNSNTTGSSQTSSVPGLSTQPVLHIERATPTVTPAVSVTPTQVVTADEDSLESVARNADALLSILSSANFDSVSDQVISLANKSEHEKDAHSLILVFRSIFDKATRGTESSEICARLCRKMMDKINPKVQDDGLKTADGRPITGGRLFLKYLLNHTQECFERNLGSEDTNVAEASPVTSGELLATVPIPSDTEVTAYWASQQAQRQDLGVIRFMAELFKQQMIIERIMHESVKNLLRNVEKPDEKRVECLCELLTTSGARLDTSKARAHMDVYFSRMRSLAANPSLGPRTQAIIKRVLELRDRKWVSPGNQSSEPTTTNNTVDQVKREVVHKKSKKGKKK